MLDLSEGYLQCPLGDDAPKLFTIAVLKELLTLTRLLQGILNAMAYLQGTAQREFEKLNGITRLDGIVTWGRKSTICCTRWFLSLAGWSMYPTTHKHMLYDTSTKQFCFGTLWQCGENTIGKGYLSQNEVDAGIAVDDINHESARFLNGVYHELQLR